ncbi:MAG: hypothetical protein AAB839_00880 [Patescibacteria group bacterium]
MTKEIRNQILVIVGSVIVGVAAGLTAYLVTLNTSTAVPDVSNAQESETLSDSAISSSTHEGDAPLYITTMTHMESIFKDDEREQIFQKHVADIRWAMDLFDEYGAKLTIESEEPFAIANTKWGVPILKEIVDKGHGVGSHADFGYDPTGRNPMDTEELTSEAKKLKAVIDDLVGAEDNQSISGAIGTGDWVIAAHNAGYAFKDGVTGIAYLSMPESARAPGWTDAYIYEQGYHEGVPPDFEDNIYPLALKDAKDLVSDTDPLIVVMGGELGELASLDEGRESCFPACAYTAADNTVVIEAIKKADDIRDRSRVAHLNMHIPVKLLTSQNEETLRALLKAIQTYVDNGSIIWETQLGAYEGYEKWGR